VKNRLATAPLLWGLLAFVASSTPPTIARADGTEVVAGLAPASPPPSPPDPTAPTAPPATRRSMQIAAFVLGGVAVAGAGAGAAFGVLALNDKSSFDAHPTSRSASLANENAVLSDVFLGGAVVAAVTSIVLFVRFYHAPPEASAGDHGPLAPVPKASSAVTFTLSPLITLHGGGAGAALRF
jgi:hypothetical protein